MKAIKSDSKVGGKFVSSFFFTFNIFLTNLFFHSTFSDASFCNDPIHSMEFMYTYIYMPVCCLHLHKWEFQKMIVVDVAHSIKRQTIL